MKFVAFERAMQGTGASRRLRITGRTPGIVYGGTGQPLLIELDHNALWHALKKEAFHSSILEMELAGQTSKVLLRDVQYHPFKQLVLHVDFQRVDANTKLHMKVPLHYSGDENFEVFAFTFDITIRKTFIDAKPSIIYEELHPSLLKSLLNSFAFFSTREIGDKHLA